MLERDNDVKLKQYSIAKDGRVNSVWWNNLIGIKSGVVRWFDDNLGQKDGNGTETLFW